jgi:hypothetical protein
MRRDLMRIVTVLPSLTMVFTPSDVSSTVIADSHFPLATRSAACAAGSIRKTGSNANSAPKKLLGQCTLILAIVAFYAKSHLTDTSLR